MYLKLTAIVLTSLLVSGCSHKKVTPEEMTKHRFMLDDSYKSKVSNKVVQKLIYSKSKVGYRVTYSSPSISSPSIKCSRDLFSDGITCKYYGKASITYGVPALRRYGQRAATLKYEYTVSKNGSVSVYWREMMSKKLLFIIVAAALLFSGCATTKSSTLLNDIKVDKLQLNSNSIKSSSSSGSMAYVDSMRAIYI